MAGDGEPGVARGANVISLLPATADSAGARSWTAANANVKGTGEFRRLALAQWVDNQRGRELAPEVQLSALTHQGESHDSHAAFKLPYDPAHDADPDEPYRWAMTIDNDKCTGCGACVVACDIENNVPQVGEQQCIMHREMSWIRLDRYNGDGDREGGAERRPYPNREKLGEVDVRIQAMLCQHCGAAPCESVCPVIATYHTPEGLNGMVYNRCVGTRYCANNCTYKVRRFNYWDYSSNNWPGLLDMMLNPDVTVRGRGVMEKCTFCVQRIASARQGAKDESRSIADGEVKTACQQSCPAGAIGFGNAKDAESVVVANASDKVRGYHALHDLNTRPAITYLAQVRREGKNGAAPDDHEPKGSH
jgi:Fe-S-cluster-containing dehydrogenase component